MDHLRLSFTDYKYKETSWKKKINKNSIEREANLVLALSPELMKASRGMLV